MKNTPPYFAYLVTAYERVRNKFPFWTRLAGGCSSGFEWHAIRLRNGAALQGDIPAKARDGVIASYDDNEQRRSVPVRRGTNREVVPRTFLSEVIVPQPQIAPKKLF